MKTPDERVVLVALDGSPQATRAIPLARTVAGQLRAKLVAIHAAPGEVIASKIARAVGLEESDLDDLSVRVRVGSPSEVILEEVERPGVDLLVLTTLAAGEPDRELGSVARQVAVNTARPILALRPEIGLEKTQTAPPLERLLVPLDGTQATASALKPITPFAARLGASVDVLYVAEDGAGTDERGSLSAPRYVDQQQHEWGNWTREVRERLMVEGAGFSPSAHIAVHIRRGAPGTEIVRFAREGHYDAIVLVRRSRLEAERALTLRAVIRQSPCPLLVVGGEM